MNSYMIFCVPGAGGLFLTTVVSMMLDLPMHPTVHGTGHAHDMGQGEWKEPTRDICLIGDHWQLNYRASCKLYYTHTIPSGWLLDNPQIHLVRITANPHDYRKITELYVKKAWPNLWTEEEYHKWAGSDYPPYSPDNIKHSKIVLDDLMADLEITTIHAWFRKNSNIEAHSEIEFQTIMGVNGQDLAQQISDIIHVPITHQVREYIDHYQQINQDLYFVDVQ